MEVVLPALCLLASPAVRQANAWSTPLDDDLAMKFADRRDAEAFLTSRWLTSEAAGRVLDVPTPQVQITRECTQCGSTAHGRPLSGEAWLSASRRRDLVAAAASGVPVAVDLEPVQAGSDVPDSCLTRGERDAGSVGRLRLWTRKECLVKLGLCSLDDFGIVSAGDPHMDSVQIGAVHMSSRLVRPHMSQPYLVTVASLGRRPPTPAFVSRRDGTPISLNERGPKERTGWATT